MNSVKNVLSVTAKKCRAKLVMLLFTVLLSSAAVLVPPQLLKRIVDECLIGKNADALPLLALIYTAVTVITGLLDFAQERIITQLGEKMLNSLRAAMARKLTRMDTPYFSKKSSGSILSVFQNDVQNIATLFSGGIAGIFTDCIKIIGIVASIWLFNPTLGIFTLLLLPLIFALTELFRRGMLISQKENLDVTANVNNRISESIHNIFMVKSFGKEKYMEDNYQALLREKYRVMNRVFIYDASYSPIIQVMTAAAISVAVIIVCGRNGAFGLTVGMLSASAELITKLFAPIDSLGTELQSIQTGLSGISSVDGFFMEKELKKDYRRDISADGAVIRFENVSFSYDGTEKILDGIDLEIKPCESVCLAGRTGAGKSTAFRLIAGLLTPTSGRVTINGADVSAVPPEMKRRIFGYVEQKFSFIHGTIMEQITLRDNTVTRTQAEAAMRFTGLHDYVMSLPQGYETPCESGSIFSQGQKQLLCIARAIAADPSVLLLDEVTASLDTATEEKIMEVMRKLERSKTIISVSHRLSSINEAERVLYLEGGKIVSDGLPQEIIGKHYEK